MSVIRKKVLENLDSTFVTVGLFVLAVILVFGLAIAGANAWERKACSAKTADIGFDARYSFVGGCQIEVTNGQWIPLENYYFKQQ